MWGRPFASRASDAEDWNAGSIGIPDARRLVDRLDLPGCAVEAGVVQHVARVDHMGLAGGVQGQAAIADLKDGLGAVNALGAAPDGPRRGGSAEAQQQQEGQQNG